MSDEYDEDHDDGNGRRSRKTRRMSDAELHDFNMAQALIFSDMLRRTAELQWSSIEMIARSRKPASSDD